jgi:hypothetical protein
VPTSGGSGALRQFTTDKRLLLAAIDAIGLGRSFSPREAAMGTVGAIRYVAAGMRRLPGRKSLVLLADGFSLRDFDDRTNANQLIGTANQAGVVINGVDTRGLAPLFLTAGDNTQGDPRTGAQVDVNAMLDDRRAKFRDTQRGLRYLAAETGGLAFYDGNDFHAGLRRILDDQSSYYLLGFQTDDQDAARLRRVGVTGRLQVRVRRPGLVVRYRKQYLGSLAAEPEAKPRTAVERLAEAIRSPFAGAAIPLRLSAAFDVDEHGQPVIQTMIHISGTALSFGPPDAEGYCAAKIRLAAVTDSLQPGPPAISDWSYRIRVLAASLERIRKEGFVYSFEHKLKTPGSCQLRVALLDEASDQIGSASRFVEAPELRKGELTLSGLVMHSAVANAQQADISAVMRVFERGKPFSYGVTVNNARLGVELEARLLRDGRVVWEGQRLRVTPASGADPRRIPTGSVLTLGEKTTPGEYVLEVRALDPKSKRPAPSQWIDFELR